ncbi:MAG: hypothetical protein IPP96_17960 [Chitinophagaceae bacterium]|nr:hypothetical protein [Chitinophagaceae bacterium]
MDLKKLFMGGIVAGILYFLLGWLIYGMLLTNFMNNHTGAAGNIMKTEPDFLYLAIGNLAMGFLLAYVFVKSNVSSMAGGFITGGVLGLLMSVGYDCMIYSTTTTLSKTAMAADVAAATVMTAVVGAITAMVMGMGKKAA